MREMWVSTATLDATFLHRLASRRVEMNCAGKCCEADAVLESRSDLCDHLTSMLGNDSGANDSVRVLLAEHPYETTLARAIKDTAVVAVEPRDVRVGGDALPLR